MSTGLGLVIIDSLLVDLDTRVRIALGRLPVQVGQMMVGTGNLCNIESHKKRPPQLGRADIFTFQPAAGGTMQHAPGLF